MASFRPWEASMFFKPPSFFSAWPNSTPHASFGACPLDKNIKNLNATLLSEELRLKIFQVNH
jgi:hypothetical protein